jgi:hypothetical protein
MQPQAKPQKDRGKNVGICGGYGLTFEGLPANEVGGKRVENMEQKKDIKRDRQDILVELFGQSLVHDAFGNAESGEDEKKHDGEQDPAALAVDRSEYFWHTPLLISSMKNEINFVNKKIYGCCQNLKGATFLRRKLRSRFNQKSVLRNGFFGDNSPYCFCGRSHPSGF